MFREDLWLLWGRLPLPFQAKQTDPWYKVTALLYNLAVISLKWCNLRKLTKTITSVSWKAINIFLKGQKLLWFFQKTYNLTRTNTKLKIEELLVQIWTAKLNVGKIHIGLRMVLGHIIICKCNSYVGFSLLFATSL